MLYRWKNNLHQKRYDTTVILKVYNFFQSYWNKKNNATKRVSPMTTLLSKDEILLKGSVITKVKAENFEKFSQ